MVLDIVKIYIKYIYIYKTGLLCKILLNTTLTIQLWQLVPIIKQFKKRSTLWLNHLKAYSFECDGY